MYGIKGVLKTFFLETPLHKRNQKIRMFAAQILFMKRCWNTLSGTGSQPYKRHRHSGSAGTSDLSIWLSVDPMADKYPSMSPYTYCGNNPVRLVDQDGEDIINSYKKS